MRMRTKLSIVTLVGAGALLLMCPGRYHRVPRASRQRLHQSAAPGLARFVCGGCSGEHNVGAGSQLEFRRSLPRYALQSNDCDQISMQPGPIQADSVTIRGARFKRRALKQLHPFESKSQKDGNGDDLRRWRTLSGRYSHWKTYGSVSHRIPSGCEAGPYKIETHLDAFLLLRWGNVPVHTKTENLQSSRRHPPHRHPPHRPHRRHRRHPPQRRPRPQRRHRQRRRQQRQQ